MSSSKGAALEEEKEEKTSTDAKSVAAERNPGWDCNINISLDGNNNNYNNYYYTNKPTELFCRVERVKQSSSGMVTLTLTLAD